MPDSEQSSGDEQVVDSATMDEMESARPTGTNVESPDSGSSEVGIETGSEDADPATTNEQNNESVEAQSVDVSVIDPSTKSPKSYGVTPELASLLETAARIHRTFETDFELSFHSLFLSFLHSTNAVSLWLRDYALRQKVREETSLRQLNLTPEQLLDAISKERPENERNSPLRATSSAQQILNSAEELRTFIDPDHSNGELDVRHIMAAFVYRPGNHESDISDLGLEPAEWSEAFLRRIGRLYRHELGHWKRLHNQTYPDRPVTLLLDLEGPSAHIATDKWTIVDALEYDGYAHAISEFIVHPDTVPPLCISIQAHWGGGKTSLMKMIQNKVDPAAFESPTFSESTEKLTLKGALCELDKWLTRSNGKEDQSKQLSADQDSSLQNRRKRELQSVWFNAWKYESTNQVWSGLVDAIVSQVTDRMEPLERERFLFRLHLTRVDPGRIRERAYEHIYRLSLKALKAWAWIPLLIGICLEALLSYWASFGPPAQSGIAKWLLALPPILTAGFIKLGFGKENEAAKEQPAKTSLSDILDVPDYRAEIGFIHNVDFDMRRIFDRLREDGKQLVVFVDDLDRCSPTKVAQVMEAINLFLAGEFPECVFVLGMDAEMVAAALQAAHAAMIACLPTDAAIPVGWRFMDKFVQLPFVIPPVGDKIVHKYALTLMRGDPETVQDAKQAIAHAEEVGDQVSRLQDVSQAVSVVKEKHKLTESQAQRVQDRLEQVAVRKEIDTRVKEYRDSEEVRNLIVESAGEFSKNPRELKRFVNAFRFHLSLLAAREAQDGLDFPSIQQLQRWVIFSMKWPDVARWLRRSGGREWRALTNSSEAQPSRLRILEDMAGNAGDLVTWQFWCKEILGLDPMSAPWLNDDDLLEFLHKEYHGYPEMVRLSSASGKGFW
jgi:hypothetical protein